MRKQKNEIRDLIECNSQRKGSTIKPPEEKVDRQRGEVTERKTSQRKN